MDLERRDRQADHPLELVADARADRLGDLGELQAVLDDDAELDDEAVRADADVYALLDAPRQHAGETAAAREGDDPVALGRCRTDDLRDRVRRDRDASALGLGDHEGLALHRASLMG